MKKQKYRKAMAGGILLAILVTIACSLPVQVFAGENIPVVTDIKVTYIVDGNVRTAGGDRFTLTADDPLSPMPDGTVGGRKEITITDEGSYSFGDIRYERPDVYWYTVTRDVTEKKGVVKDRSVYKAKVIALNDGHGYVLVYKSGSSEKQELVYLDRVAPNTGDDSSIMIYFVMTAAAAAALTLFVTALERGKRRESQGKVK